MQAAANIKVTSPRIVYVMFENLLTKIEKIAKTTTLAKETIFTKQGKGEPRKRRRFGKYPKRNKNFSLKQERHQSRV